MLNYYLLLLYRRKVIPNKKEVLIAADQNWMIARS